MVYRKRREKISQYDPLTGEPLYLAEEVCPNKRHLFDGHNRKPGFLEDGFQLSEDLFDE